MKLTTMLLCLLAAPTFASGDTNSAYTVRYVPDGETVIVSILYCNEHKFTDGWVMYRADATNPIPFGWSTDYANHMCRILVSPKK